MCRPSESWTVKFNCVTACIVWRSDVSYRGQMDWMRVCSRTLRARYANKLKFQVLVSEFSRSAWDHLYVDRGRPIPLVLKLWNPKCIGTPNFCDSLASGWLENAWTSVLFLQNFLGAPARIPHLLSITLLARGENGVNQYKGIPSVILLFNG